MAKNNKFVTKPPAGNYTLSEVLNLAMVSGAGKSLDGEGNPDGSWTVSSLCDEIMLLDKKGQGVDPRTVHRWLKPTGNGINRTNLRIISRVFAADKEENAQLWLQKLIEAQSFALARSKRQKQVDMEELSPPMPGEYDNSDQSDTAQYGGNLALWTEKIVINSSNQSLPVMIFAGAIILGVLAFTFNIHSVKVSNSHSVVKEVGFLWAPNWTIVFLVILPAYTAILASMISKWKILRETLLVRSSSQRRKLTRWKKHVSANTTIFWTIFVTTIPISSGIVWITTHLIPLMNGTPDGLAIDWGLISITQPQLISISESLIFSAAVYVYNGLCAYVFFSGLAFFLIVVDDLVDILVSTTSTDGLREVLHNVVNPIAICSMLGLSITICIVVQGTYLLTDAPNLLNFLYNDLLIMSGTQGLFRDLADYRVPSLFNSFFSLSAIVAIYLSCQIKLRVALRQIIISKENEVTITTFPWAKANISIALLIATYLSFGFIVGSSWLLVASIFVITIILLHSVRRVTPLQIRNDT